jgi:hypothetical protein
MKLAIVRQTYNPNGGAERFVSRALNVLAQDTTLDVTLIARQWEDASGWKTLTVNPPFRNRIARESGFAVEAASHFAQFDIVQSHERIPGQPFSAQAMAYTPPGLSSMAAFVAAGTLGAVIQPLSPLYFAGRSADVYPSAAAHRYLQLENGA